MANRIQIKRSSTAADVPTTDQLAQGELAVNLVDKKLYTKDHTDSVVLLNPEAPTIDIASTEEAEAGTNNTNFITPLRMREGFNAEGSAPVFACRAWVNFNGVTDNNLTGTYSQTGTTVTVTMTAHGYITGNVTSLDFTSGTAVDGVYTVTVVDANTFTVTQDSRTTSGNVTSLRSLIRASGNVSSVSKNGIGDYSINYTTALPDADYAIDSSADDSNTDRPLITGPISTSAPTAASCRIVTMNPSNTRRNGTYVSFKATR